MDRHHGAVRIGQNHADQYSRRARHAHFRPALSSMASTLSRLDEAGLTRFRSEKIGFVFQQFHLVPYLTALENVMLAQYFHSTTDEGEARAALDRVGLADRIDASPAQLSGGEQQRVAVARALINHPKLILADEPTGNLDEANEEIVLRLLSRTPRRRPHDPHGHARAFDRPTRRPPHRPRPRPPRPRQSPRLEYFASGSVLK